ncbi:manganese and iron superoxide dismutase [Hypoxylon sp. FL0543]|nr:manganese and iron superoxide dismutase [Hypoxylon sp. FL0543]
MLRPRLRIPRASRLWCPAISCRPTIPCRQIHHVPPLKQFDPEEGVPNLLSPQGFDIAWTQYMQYIIERLNATTAGTEFEGQEPLSILKATAREPSQAPIFNYASMAHNNALFFENIANVTRQSQEGEGDASEDRIPHGLKHLLVTQFSSIETLRREFLVTAMGMFGPGFVWLVKNANTTDLRILVTYLAGTPYTAGHWRRQGLDMNTQGINSPTTTVSWFERAKTGAGADNGARFIPQNQTAPGGLDTIPLLCLNTWEHVWLCDYGVGAGGIGGKKEYVQRWWDVIDWEKVENLAQIHKVPPKMK